MANGKYRQKRAGTETSSFGTPGRINHDSTKFYKSRLYEGLNSGKSVKTSKTKYLKRTLIKYFANPVKNG